jgi:hypothetical protein
MSKFKIIKGIDSALNRSGKNLLDIQFLGIGGAFDTEEGTSSALFKTRGGSRFLIDCGYTSYSKLRKRNLIDKVDVVFITHCHEDHINGLSTLIYDRYYMHNLETIIECTEAVGKRVKAYLDICGHPEGQYEIYTESNVFYQEEKISVTKIDTTPHHWPIPGFPNSGLLFHFETENDYAVVVYSGDINVPITNLMKPEEYPFVYDNPENVFIFHDMTSLVHEQNPHTHFNLLLPVLENFNNLYTYHHGQDTIERINKVSSVMASTSLIIQGEDFVIEERMGS